MQIVEIVYLIASGVVVFLVLLFGVGRKSRFKPMYPK
jgi:hypothetical protein